jgi:transcriptional regulator GlxA family with amidase domain
MEDGDATADAELNEWIRRRWSAETLLVTICGGSYNAARAGLLTGRRATAHQNVLRLVRQQHPEVAWLDGLPAAGTI